MPRQMPTKLVMELALTRETMTPAEAFRWGLSNRVVPSDQVLSSDGARPGGRREGAVRSA